VRLLLHVLFDLLTRGFELIHDPLGALLGLVLLVLLPVMLHLEVRVCLVLL